MNPEQTKSIIINQFNKFNMKSDYEERKAAKLEKYEELANKNEQLSNNLFNQSSRMAEVIPFGQPILIGHHSEHRDRAYRDRIQNTSLKALEASKKADYYKERAESLLNNNSISSDDPNAINKLTEKLTKLQDKQEVYKQINKIVYSKKIAEIEKISELQKLGLTENTAIKLMSKENFGGPGIPSFSLTNNNAKISSTKKRIQHLQNIAKLETKEIIINGITLRQNVEANRIQILFPDIPAEETRKILKSSGFHWSPTESAWQRQISYYANRQAIVILNNLITI